LDGALGHGAEHTPAYGSIQAGIDNGSGGAAFTSPCGASLF
jgi:hypothetical protein